MTAISGKIVLMGGAGMIGQRLISELTSYRMVVTSSRQSAADYAVDFSNVDEASLTFIDKGDVVLLAAAVSSPDICKQQPEYARSVNVDGTRKVIEYCLNVDAKVIFFSSDTVYGETLVPVTEDMALTPVGDYAIMKAEIEELFGASDAFIALRLSYVVSAEDKFSSYLHNCTINSRSAEIFHPLNRCAVWVGDLTAAIKSLVEIWPTDTPALNVGGPKLVSRVDMAEAFIKGSGERLNYDVVEPESEFYDARPVTISMNTQKLENFLGRKLNSLENAYQNEYKNRG